MTVIFTLRLGDDGSPEERKKYVRLPPPVDRQPYVLRLVITAGCVASRKPTLHTNYPAAGETFERSKFQSVDFHNEGLADSTVEITIRIPGVFEYYVEYDNWQTGQRTCSKTPGALVVDPRLYLPNTALNDPRIKSPEKILLPLDGVSVLTVIPKWMPTLPHWPPYFSAFAETGYNMVHFAPMNARGTSNSPYSIYDQLSLSDDLFDARLSEKEKEESLGNTLEKIRKENGILSVTDIVWNHTACNSSWLQEHPEAGYNLKTSPHLRPAYELEEALLQFSDDLVQKYGKPAAIHTEEDLQRVLDVVKSKVIPRVKLWEFYIVDVLLAVAEMRKVLSSQRRSRDQNRYSSRNLSILSLQGQAQLLSHDCLMDAKDGSRYAKTINSEVAAEFIQKLAVDLHLEDLETQISRYEAILNEINLPLYQEHDADVVAIIENITNRARFLRIEPHGPKLGAISREKPLVDTYFTRLPRNEVTTSRHADELVLANNGWIWNADPLINFAAAGSKSYLRREVIAWSDCVKLRYGDKPEDNPWLWEHQIAYTQKMARLFDGLRIDNCHSTPLHVASALLDAGRRVNPDLYVFAELFTGSEEKDIMFVSKLGINSLIREAMNAWDPHELSRLVHRYGGQPVGSLTFPPENFPLDILGHDLNSNVFTSSAEEEEILVDVKGSAPHALFMDCTHDNETPHQKRTAADTLPNAAIVAMSSCAVGSVMGYDEIVPELLNLVTESRKYRVPDFNDGILPAKSVLYNVHLKMAREGYSEIHVHQEHDFISIHRLHPVTHEGYLLIARTAFHHHHDEDVHSPIFLRNQVVHVLESGTLTVQGEPSDVHTPTHWENEPHDPGNADGLLPLQSPTAMYHTFDIPAPGFRQVVGKISGLPSTLTFSTTITTKSYAREEATGGDGDMQTVITIDKDTFRPGSIVLYRTSIVGNGKDEPRVSQDMTISVSSRRLSLSPGVFASLWSMLGMDRTNEGIEVMVKLGWDVLGSGHLWYGDKKTKWPPGLWEAVKGLDMLDINVALYRSAAEEEDTTGDSVYDVPGYGRLSYCGLQGFVSASQPVARNNDLGHPVFGNLRSGPWMAEYIVARLKRHLQMYPALTALRTWLSDRLALVKKLSPSFSPKYFTFVVCSAYQALRYRALTMDASRLHICQIAGNRKSSLEAFNNACSMMTFQLYGRVSSTGLVPAQYPLDLVAPDSGPPDGQKKRNPSLAAGLPHFATQYMRCWGRDIFISLRGMILRPGHYHAARAHLIAFGSTLRHGLIPNLLDQGIMPRYNARDAAWWWLYSVAEYCRLSPEGYAFLGMEVARRFTPRRRYRNPDYLAVADEDDDGQGDTYCPCDDPSRAFVHRNTIAQLCHELLERHARGIKFREWNAGANLDHAMRSEGFDVEARVDWQMDGLVVGGNRWNCGTWMDKMGDSEKAGIKGVPATPRDGAAVEICGLAKAALKWVVEDVLGKGLGKKWWTWEAVLIKDGNGHDKLVTYLSWNTMLQSSFEKQFYVPTDPNQDPEYAIDNPSLVHRRGIYRDTVGGMRDFMGFQLRPNFCIAMVVAPEMFNPDHARHALDVVKEQLVGPLGIKTLDPRDWAYRGVYDNANDGTDATVAHGFNYHQGPEWVYPLGFFLRAYLYFHTKAPGHDPSKVDSVYAYIQRVLLRHKHHILDSTQSPYAGLPELTNENGGFCGGSCPTQAWSGAVMIELVADLLAAAKL
ncbi:hypothetical protein SpCBS45565_g01374 [Spizellomyces sp. 'palustris']|nr:hypothetical protein SpCBS45565_g01374 [Spizellomyces sp. 'palustris']